MPSPQETELQLFQLYSAGGQGPHFISISKPGRAEGRRWCETGAQGKRQKLRLTERRKKSQGDKTRVAWTEAEKSLQRLCDRNGPENALGWTD